MIKKMSLLILLLSISACATVKEKAGGLKKLEVSAPLKLKEH